MKGEATDQDTPQLSREDSRFLAEKLTHMSKLMQRQIDTCFHCGQKVTKLEKVGRSVFGRPCGCRLWQGNVPDAWKF
jgi:hypothetical protein